LFFVANVEEHEADDVVQALDITHFIVIISIRLEHIEKFIVSTVGVLAPHLQLTKRAIHIFLNLTLGLGVGEFDELGVQVGRVIGSGTVYVEQFDPEFASQVFWCALIDNVKSNLFELTSSQSLLLHHNSVPPLPRQHIDLLQLVIGVPP